MTPKHSKARRAYQHSQEYLERVRPSCPHCFSTKTRKCGKIRTDYGGKIQNHECLDCHKHFMEGRLGSIENFPAVLLVDIETLPGIGYFWQAWDTNIAPAQVIKDWCILSWSAKWLDDDRMMSEILTPDEALKRDDKRICKSMWQLFDDADIIIAQNGKKFDVRKLNSRWWHWKMGPPSSYKVIDTLETAQRIFSLTFNNLDTLGEYLGLGRKIKTDFSWWIRCDQGEKFALDQMREYNENDVSLLENVYVSMRPWIPNHPKLTVYDKVVGKCPVCFSDNYEHIGLYQAPVKQYKEFRCNACGSVWHSTKAEK